MAVGGVTLLGHGRLGSAITEGWRLAGIAFDPAILTRQSPPGCPPGTRTLVIAVKPAAWREAVTPLEATLPADATVLSVMAGVRAADIAAVLPGRPVVRVMPTTAVAQAQGVAAIWSADAGARAQAHSLFDPIADTVDLEEEGLIDAATAVAGSAPAFFYALAQALAEAGSEAGLSPDAASRLTRGALRSAGAGAGTDAGLDDLIARIASPGGTTRAGLDALEAAGLDATARSAVQAAIRRAQALAGDQPA
ncbi:pyrroline-5-carboxylate reductase family protein [Brevundimonas subvibrioides]|uniref:Pyrroline-5-carboxylate reductase n=1 Tax=Brevundimonas subvibrioides (strain ATCC 15264 / DSM 4735 / LMG 14903 / NBRC 16000 / CB 81) TaxID=633149 RepID=D9QMX8_BRESC|nr:pyrroline-5-carboxylate reductase dimerization domain-containing protein [Brevundimonas subvibrioides]ADL02134.1 pyrroline-5-carboxylate reductase [Brevundimonas subvibrioides ATCC 15264]